MFASDIFKPAKVVPESAEGASTTQWAPQRAIAPRSGPSGERKASHSGPSGERQGGSGVRFSAPAEKASAGERASHQRKGPAPAERAAPAKREGSGGSLPPSVPGDTGIDRRFGTDD
ncbi:hypothetical protein DFH09DRAFT_1068608 [Mycena vulgaris]|nr:hypothetical protein DFH09DRAFT_1068608 [Mycena vulgaris]